MAGIKQYPKWTMQEIEISTVNDTYFRTSVHHPENATDEELDAAGQRSFEAWCKKHGQDPDYASWCWG